ncbi:MAG: FAD-dependent oxidoreductase [Synergistaceae bacterium]|nr:FAD-dependent oxidoreductase [Synergistaceae bacterium]
MTAAPYKRIDVAVIGAGPAGIAAACAARTAGADRVVVFDRDAEPGGILQQCVHTGFGLHTFGEELTGPEYMHRYIERARCAGVEFEPGATVFGMEKPESRTGRRSAAFWVSSARCGVERVEAGAAVLAMGCRERPAGALGLAGTRPSGVYTAGAAQRLVNMEGLLPGRHVAVMGTGDIGLIMARRMTLEGALVVGVFEIMPWVSGLRRNIAQCLDDFGIPYYLNRSVCELRGYPELEGLIVEKMGRDGKPIEGSGEFVSCGTLLLAVGLIPENELTRMAGIGTDPLTNGPVVNDLMQTTSECVFAAGNAVAVYDLVDFVSREGERAGRNAAMYAMGRLTKGRRDIAVIPGENVRSASPQIITGAENVALYLRVSSPIEGKCRLEVSEGLCSADLRYARPGEMNTAHLRASDIASLPPEVKSVTVSVKEA